MIIYRPGIIEIDIDGRTLSSRAVFYEVGRSRRLSRWKSRINIFCLTVRLVIRKNGIIR